MVSLAISSEKPARQRIVQSLFVPCLHTAFRISKDIMSSIDLDQLLAPVSADEPCGPDLEYDPELAELELASKGKPEQEYGDTVIEAEEPEWKVVKRLALSLLQRTKDLRVAVPLGDACLALGDLDGFQDSLSLINTFVTEFWESVHPQLDADDDNDPTARVNAVAALLAPGGTLKLLRNTPLVRVQGIGQFSFTDVEIAASGHDSDDLPTEATISGAFLDCNYDTLVATQNAFNAIHDHVTGIENQLSLKVGTSNAVNMAPLSGLINDIRKILSDNLQKRGANEQEVDETPDDDEVDTTVVGAAPPSKKADGEIRGREDVIRAIDRICEYYEKHEPSSPLPLLLNRAKRLATKSFMEILRDLTPDALGQAESIGGVESKDDDD